MYKREDENKNENENKKEIGDELRKGRRAGGQEEEDGKGRAMRRTGLWRGGRGAEEGGAKRGLWAEFISIVATTQYSSIQTMCRHRCRS